jgi:hypothetical protein
MEDVKEQPYKKKVTPKRLGRKSPSKPLKKNKTKPNPNQTKLEKRRRKGANYPKNISSNLKF